MEVNRFVGRSVREQMGVVSSKFVCPLGIANQIEINYLLDRQNGANPCLLNVTEAAKQNRS